MSKPIIGIIGNIDRYDNGVFLGSKRSYVNNDYVTSVVQAGGVPLVLPILDDEEMIRIQVESVDGILISGGADINPLIYGEEPTEKLECILEERDYFEINVIKIAMALGKPILGICRGLQILNVAFGGTLHQDLSFIDSYCIKHLQESKDSLQEHVVNIYRGNKLYDILGSHINTNSFHHQSIKEIAPGFKVSAMSEDFIVEAIEKEGESFVMGVQWHPEVMAAQGNIEMKKLFEKFVQHSVRWRLKNCG